ETMSQAYLYEDVPEAENSSKMVAPGYTICCADMYLYNPEGGPVTFQLEGFHGDTFQYSADPGDEGRTPADTFEMKQDGSIPSCMEGAPETDGSVEILDFEKSQDFNFEDTIKVNFEFTNNTDEKTSCYPTYNIYAMQDGYELKHAFSSGEDEEEDNDKEDIEPGESIRFNTSWIPRTDSPITIVVKEGRGHSDYFGKTLDIK
ncbi:MAG: DUF5067 domain-containing protein, partial [Lachnospiraceae bacterium]|nr:DUF5067 domain-containing protein [Lachnospiraceae bacterium]